MTDSASPQATDLIAELIRFEDGAEIQMTDAYRQLRRMADALFRGERPDHTLQPTALANEAYLLLSKPENKCWETKGHFFGAAARAMKQVLIGHARKRRSDKRGGLFTRVELDCDLTAAPTRPADFLALAEALDRLAAGNQRQAQVVELRFYAGLTIRETAEAVGRAESTVKKDWAAAREWLRIQLSAGV